MKFLTKEQFIEMAAMQDELNSLINPAWKYAGYNWDLYIKDEVMEFFSYIGFKHWKDTDSSKKPEDPQARLEAVDIWHFLLSKLIESGQDRSAEAIYNSIASCVDFTESTSTAEQLYSVQTLDCCTLSNFSKLERLTDMLALCNWSWEEVLETYIQKYVLNKFRQDHGYKNGTYCKSWKSEITIGDTIVAIYKEDNEVLADLVQSRKEYGLEVTNQEGLYNDLKVLYNERLNK